MNYNVYTVMYRGDSPKRGDNAGYSHRMEHMPSLEAAISSAMSWSAATAAGIGYNLFAVTLFDGKIPVFRWRKGSPKPSK